MAALYSDVIVRHSTITGNTANSNGGGIFSLSSNVTVTDSTISGNSAPGVSGGGIASNYGNLTVTGSTISDNSAGGNGGGIWDSGTILPARSAAIRRVAMAVASGTYPAT